MWILKNSKAGGLAFSNLIEPTISLVHSIRATGATILAKNMYYNAQIMAVTGHKFVQALSMYQRADDEDEIRMGKTLTDNAF
jgi:hypothetical protein